MRRAVIDIGTNTVKLLVADVRDGQVFPVAAKDQTTRLGEGVQETRQLRVPAMERTLQAITDYVAEARQHSAADILALTTSAARSAHNCTAFLAAVRARCGVDVQVLSDEREAELIFRGVASDPAWHDHPLLVLDIGGGSVEVIQGKGGKVEEWKSLPVGAVRMMEQFGDNFPALAEFLRTTFRPALKEFHASGRKFIATGGATITLVRVAKGQADHAGLTRAEVLALVARLSAMTLAERKQVPGLPPERADIIVAGGAALAFAMEALGVYELTVSTRNLRSGALLENECTHG